MIAPGITTTEPLTLAAGDNLALLRMMPADCVDLVLCSPPYADARTYSIGFNLAGVDYVDWAFERYMECLRVSRGLVAWVIEGRTRKFTYDATPILLAARLHQAGAKLRKPPIYKRFGIFGSGGPDFWRNDYELVICATKRGRLPWSDATAIGHPPKCPPGGAPTHRRQDGSRAGGKAYTPPKIANPGNVIDCGAVGGGNIGNKLAHENEAPYPYKLAEAFVKCFCPPAGVVLDPFIGSGTTASAALCNDRRAIGFDIRPDQIELTRRRVTADVDKHKQTQEHVTDE